MGIDNEINPPTATWYRRTQAGVLICHRDYYSFSRGLHLRVAASYVHDAVAQRVQKLKRSLVVSLVVLHHSLAHGDADGLGRLVLVVVSRLSAETSQREVRLW